jgi:hypothetical protein
VATGEHQRLSVPQRKVRGHQGKALPLSGRLVASLHHGLTRPSPVVVEIPQHTQDFISGNNQAIFGASRRIATETAESEFGKPSDQSCDVLGYTMRERAHHARSGIPAT